MLKSSPADTGEELFRRYLDGDSGAFEELVALYANEMSSFIYGIVHDRHEAKHLTIEAFARLAAAGARFAGRSTLKTYLFAIARRLALRYMKMRRRAQHVSFEEIADTMVDAAPLPESQYEKEYDARRLRQAMRCLSDDHRTVLMLLYFEDMSYREAGGVMSKTERQIEGLARRAKLALKKMLQDGGGAQDGVGVR